MGVGDRGRDGERELRVHGRGRWRQEREERA